MISVATTPAISAAAVSTTIAAICRIKNMRPVTARTLQFPATASPKNNEDRCEGQEPCKSERQRQCIVVRSGYERLGDNDTGTGRHLARRRVDEVQVVVGCRHLLAPPEPIASVEDIQR